MTSPPHTFPPLLSLETVSRGAVLVVAPHPDDEVIGCGGAIALHRQRGDPVHIALVTRGEAGGLDEERLAESQLAGSGLGDVSVTCLDGTDGAVGGDRAWQDRLARVVEAVSPVVVYAPSPFEMHPDHIATLDGTAEVLQGNEGIELLLYEVNTESMASFLLDITSVADSKRAALQAFASQIGQIDIVEKADARARARTVNIDLPEVTHAEAFLRLSPERVAEALSRLKDLATFLGLDPEGT